MTPYTGRFVDVLAFQPGDTSPGVVSLMEQTLALSGTGGQVCTGIQKLAQGTMLRLLTIQDSRPYEFGENINFGCSFIQDACEGRWRNSSDIRVSYAAASLDVARQMLETITETTPTDEQFNSLTLDNVEILGDRSVKLTFTLKSEASTLTFIQPISIPLR
jgi:hypothetical protein